MTACPSSTDARVVELAIVLGYRPGHDGRALSHQGTGAPSPGSISAATYRGGDVGLDVDRGGRQPAFFQQLGNVDGKSGEKNQHGSSGSQTPHRAQEGRGTN